MYKVKVKLNYLCGQFFVKSSLSNYSVNLMKLSFYGASRQVTGSMFLLETADGYKILIDCGTDLDTKKLKPKKAFGGFPIDVSLVNLVILTHAHIDHSGQIPNLYRNGFEGQVLCTSATLELAELLLLDSATLNQKKIQGIEKSRKKSHKRKFEDAEGLYLRKQVHEAMEGFVSVEFNRRFKFKDGAYVTFIPAGHLLGAAHVLLEIEDDGQTNKIAFSGDIGRFDYPLLKDPEPLPQVDYLVCESTYGNRYHQDDLSPELKLKEIIEEACVKIPGRLIVPAFSVGRTQAFLYTLNKLFEEHDLKRIKVFTDSPLAHESTRVYEKYAYLLNASAKEFKKENGELFDFENLEFMKTEQASMSINFHTEPCIIISSSGMIQGGRVEHHIAENIENPYATILLIGYATEGTIGFKLKNKDITNLIVQGKNKEVKAKIISTDVFSGHGDLKDLVTFVKNQSPEKLKKVFLVHGEYNSMLNFKSVLEKEGFGDIAIPDENDIFEI